MSKRKKVIIISILLILITIGAVCIYWIINKEKSTVESELSIEEQTWASNPSDRRPVDEAKGLIAKSKKDSDIKHNTEYLQSLMGNGNKIIKIPAGIYYFAQQKGNGRGAGYCIKCINDVLIEGAGQNETILMPYDTNESIKARRTQKRPQAGGLDMFYFNDYADTEFKSASFLKNADFKNFTIDGKDAHSEKYDSSGKGFMINLFINCDWDNVTVKNTDGTGFGVDCPINCTIKNCNAIGNGKGGKGNDPPGASGFGIGTGYTSDEKSDGIENILIENCTATNNCKYGFFFEHQARFVKNYTSTKASGFVVSNCTASNNKYDFGGAKANDVTYQNCRSTSKNSKKTLSPIEYQLHSVRTHMINCKVDQNFSDVSSSAYYYEPVKWAIERGITNGTTKTTFSPNKECTRAEAVEFIYRVYDRPGSVVLYDEDKTYMTRSKPSGNRYTTFNDVYYDDYYAKAVKWASLEKGMIDISESMFYPDKPCTRATFITMLWRAAGAKRINHNITFKDVKRGSWYEDAVKWGVYKGIIKGKSSTSFAPNDPCTRAEVVTMLYRYKNTSNVPFTLTCNYGSGKVTNPNPPSYEARISSFPINLPKMRGYTFKGWTGSNGTEPENFAYVSSNDSDSKAFTANWEPNTYYIAFNSNKGKGIMEKQICKYDMPTTLLPNLYTRKDYKFTGWNTKPDGTGVPYKDKDLINNLTSEAGEITLYAQWKKNK